jgi:predicted lipoprotein with Yx(FWY)xxD motif
VNPKLTLSLTGTALFALILAGCSSATTSPSSASASAPAAVPAAGTDLTVATTGLGKIVVDGKGMTVYFYDLDKANSGFSACTGQCAAIWPALISTTATPEVTGVSGAVGIIGGTAGDTQVTLNGRPLYTYTGDSSPGNTNGQGIQGIWYVVSPTGDEMKSAKSAKPGKAGY